MLSGTSSRWRECERDRFNSCRLALVPKDYKGPRGVYISPKEAVFLQLFQGDAMQRGVQKSWLSLCYDPYDQSPSREAAYMGSYNKGWSTLDLKDASDRITCSLINGLAYRSDYLDLCATRPTFMVLPNGETIKCRMFSPMGDGKTFPVLSYVCACLCAGAILNAQGKVPSRVKYTDLIDVAKEFRVFGDDIAVNSRYFDAVCVALELNNLKVNVKKSFTHGYFREACGIDAFHGKDITPMRLRHDPETLERRDISALCDLYNRMSCERPYYYRTLRTLELLIQAHAHGTVAFTRDPVRNPDMMYDRYALQRNLRSNRSMRISDLHRLEVRTASWREVRKYPSSLTPWWSVNYWLLSKDSSESKSLAFSAKRGEDLGSVSASKYFNQHLGRINTQWLDPAPRGFLSTQYRNIDP
jgi:hypothetical protein